jgi:hypothetical protein
MEYHRIVNTESGTALCAHFDRDPVLPIVVLRLADRPGDNGNIPSPRNLCKFCKQFEYIQLIHLVACIMPPMTQNLDLQNRSLLEQRVVPIQCACNSHSPGYLINILSATKRPPKAWVSK